MIDRRTALGIAIAGLLVPARQALAGASQPFDAAAFVAAQAAGGPVLVHVTAPWCGTCRAQKPVVAELLATPEFAGVTSFEVDYDGQRDVREQLGVDRQSTMVVFKGRTETARAIGQTDPAIIADLLRTAL
jgi:thiol-disulfide isomerase/thioredoxin